MVQVSAWQVAPYAARLAQPLVTARGRTALREGCYLVARDTAGCWGLGEAAPLEAWGTESAAMVLAALRRIL